MLVLLASSLSARSQLSCGTTITSNVTLTSDMDCSGYGGTAITIGASNVTLDLNGYQITASAGNLGVYITGGFSNITITSSRPGGKINSSVSSILFGFGLSSNVTISDIDLSWTGNSTPNGYGIAVHGGYEGVVNGLTINNITANNREAGFITSSTTPSTNILITNSIFNENIYGLVNNNIEGLVLSRISAQNNGTGVSFAKISGPITISGVNVAGSNIGIILNSIQSGFPEINPNSFNGFTSVKSRGIQIVSGKSKDITIKNLDFSWMGGVTPQGRGIHVYGEGDVNGLVENLTIDNITINNRESGIFTWSNSSGDTSQGMTISNSTFTDNVEALSLNGINNLIVSNISISNSTSGDPKGTGINLYTGVNFASFTNVKTNNMYRGFESVGYVKNKNIEIKNSSFENGTIALSLANIENLKMTDLSLQNNEQAITFYQGIRGTFSSTNVNLAGSNKGLVFRAGFAGFPVIANGMFSGFGTVNDAVWIIGGNSSGITLQGLDLSWTGSTTPTGHGIFMDGSYGGWTENLSIDGVTANNRESGVTTWPHVDIPNMSITNSTFDNNTYGLYLYRINGLNLNQISLQNNGTGVQFGLTTGSITLSNINVAGCNDGIILDRIPTGFPTINPNSFSGFTTVRDHPIFFSNTYSKDIKIENVDLSWIGNSTPSGVGIWVPGSYNSSVENLTINNVTISNREFGIYIYPNANSGLSKNITISNSNLIKNTYSLTLGNISNYNIYHNNICSNSGNAVVGDGPYELWNHTNYQGNYWCLPCLNQGFIPGTTSNRTDIRDNYAYGVENGWLLPIENYMSRPCLVNNPPKARFNKIVFGFGGGTASNQLFTMKATIGEPFIGLAQNNQIRGSFGFWNRTNIQRLVPSLTTLPVDNITINSALGNGKINDEGSSSVTKRGFCWNTIGNPTILNSKTEEMGSFGVGPFNNSIINLVPNTKYFVKAFAENVSGVGYGEEVYFTTLPNPPICSLATDVTQTGFTVNWSELGNQGSEPLRYTVEVHTNANFTTQINGSPFTNISDLSKTISGLNPGTLYYIRIRAVNETGVSTWCETIQATQAGENLGPSIQASNLTYSNVRKTSIDVRWSPGNGDGSFLVIKRVSALSNSDLPVDNAVYRSQNRNYLMAPTLGSAKISYFGTGNICYVTGLSGSTVYYFMVCAYKGSPALGTATFNRGVSTNNPRSIRTSSAKDGEGELISNDGTFSLGTIYPNPAKDNIEFILDVPSSDAYTIEIYNEAGEMFPTGLNSINYPEGINNIKIGTHNFVSGAYTLIVKCGNAFAMQRFVVIK